MDTCTSVSGGPINSDTEPFGGFSYSVTSPQSLSQIHFSLTSLNRRLGFELEAL